MRKLDLAFLSVLMVPACQVSRPGADENDGGTDGIGVDAGDTDPDDGGSGDTGDDNDDSGDDSGDEGTDTDTGTPTCGESTWEPQAVPPNVVIVLDKSKSMILNTWDHDGDAGTDEITRWNSLYNVVQFIVETFEEQVNFGANLFPSEAAQDAYTAQACLVEAEPEVPVAANNASAILAGIPGPADVSLVGATPATAGITAARGHLVSLDPTVERFMILVTDGAANCSADAASNVERFENYDDDLPVVVGEAFTSDSIATFVVGIDIDNVVSPTTPDGSPDGINPTEELNAVAVAGGVPRDGAEQFYNAANQTELQSALQEIAGAVISCTIPLNPEPEEQQKEYVTIEIDGVEWDEVEDCATEDGWIWSNLPALDELQLCGAACDGLKESGGKLDATYGCPPVG